METAVISILGLVPVYIAIFFGGFIRSRLSAVRFRQTVLVILLMMGANLIIQQVI
jgi:hypothetical protein